MRTDVQTDVPKGVQQDLLPERVSIASHVRHTGDGDGFVLLDLEKGLYHSIDGVSARIWAGLVDGASPKQTATDIAQLCNVPVERVGRDMIRFIQSLQTKGLVTIHE